MTELVTKKYAASPIVEAVAEFRFEPGVRNGWDSASPGLIYEQLADEFPTREQVSTVDAQDVQDDNGEIRRRLEPVERLKILRENRTAAVILGPHYLAVSRLKPYESWEEFSPLIFRALTAYRDIANPAGLVRVGLRYVNRIEFNELELDIHEYFDFYPHIGANLPSTTGSFICGAQFHYAEDRDIARMQLAEAPAPDDIAAFSLDIDYFIARAGAVSFEQIGDWLLGAHATVGKLFEGAITDALREQFHGKVLSK